MKQRSKDFVDTMKFAAFLLTLSAIILITTLHSI